MQKEFDEKVTAAKELLASKGIARPLYAPTVVALLWRLGVEIPPPHFAGFAGVFAFAAILFGVAWGLIMWFAWWSHHGTPLPFAIGVSAAVGIVVGLAVAAYYHAAARKYAIPRWRDYSGSGQARA
jgi:hypothetical protein